MVKRELAAIAVGTGACVGQDEDTGAAVGADADVGAAVGVNADTGAAVNVDADAGADAGRVAAISVGEAAGCGLGIERGRSGGGMLSECAGTGAGELTAALAMGVGWVVLAARGNGRSQRPQYAEIEKFMNPQ